MYKNKKIHLIGIGGVSMSGIAKMLISYGAIVTGSNTGENDYTKMLENEGVTVYHDHNSNYIAHSEIVVYTAAISEDNPELMKAKELGLEIYERSAFLGELSKLYKNCLCISGTHGKSTTTGLISTVFLKANLDPTISVGALLPIINSNIKIGSFDYLIMEACEYVDSFLHFYPTGAIITNIDNDHLDYFKNLNNIKKSFKKYSELIPTDGYLVINSDDENSIELNDANTNVLTYGINSDAIYKAENIKFNESGCASFDIYYKKEYLTTINLNIPGKHNIYNCLAVVALSRNYISDIQTIKEAIESYTGVGRRFEYLGKYNNALIYDDYAHHPTEIATTYNSTTKFSYNQNWAIFQGHTYSRTHEHLEEFAKILAKFDNVIIAPIYPAREKNIWNVKEETLVSLIKKINPNVIFINNFKDIENYLKENIKVNDFVISIGAGPINEVTKNIAK